MWVVPEVCRRCREAADCLNEYNQLILDTIRKSGGNNQKRYVSCPGLQASPDSAFASAFKMPQDDEKGKLIDYIAKDYYVVDLTPLGENYNIRYYFDNKKNYIDYYIDISLENGEKYKMPYYIDLYLDILSYPDKSVVKFYDEEELEEALKNKIISKKDYNLAYKVGKKLKKEIEEGTNKYMNIDVLPYIDKYFK